MRIYQSGAEGGVTGYEATTGSGVNVSTVQKTGGGAYSYVIGSPNVSGQIDTGLAYSLNFPNTSSLSDYYYKSDVYIDNIANQGTGLTFLAFNSGGATDQVSVLIYNDGGTLKLVNQYNTNNYWYDAGAAHSSVVNLGVAFDTWFRLEVHVDASGTAGSHVCQVKVNGTTVINDTALTYTSPTSDNMKTGVTNLSGVDDLAFITYVDNISVNNTSGSYNNSWIGEESIIVMLSSDWGDNLASAGSIQAISEIPVTKTTSNSSTYSQMNIQSSGSGYTVMTDPVTGTGLYNSGTAGTLPSDAVVKAVSVPLYIREATSGSTSYRTGIKSASGGTTTKTVATDAGDTTVRTSPLGTTEFGRLLISETDPTSGGHWKVQGTNSLTNMQIGVEVTTSPGVYVAAIQAMVAFSPYVAPTNRGMLIMFW